MVNEGSIPSSLAKTPQLKKVVIINVLRIAFPANLDSNFNRRVLKAKDFADVQMICNSYEKWMSTQPVQLELAFLLSL